MSQELDAAMAAAGLDDAFPAEEGDDKNKQPDEVIPQAAPAEPAVPAEPVPPAEPAVPAEPVPPAEPQQTPEEIEAKRIADLEALDLDKIAPPAGVSPRNLVNFDKLRDVAKHHREVAKRVPELEAELEKAKTAGAVPAEVKKELQELRTFRKVFDAQNDPEFQAQFDGKLASIDEDLFGILRKQGLPKEAEDSMRQLGVGNIDPKFWEENILSKLSAVDRERVVKRIADRTDVMEQKDKELEKFTSQRDEILANREKVQVERFTQDKTAIETHLASITKDIPWANTVPTTGLKGAELQQAEAHNANVAQLGEIFQQSLWPATPQARAEIAAAAVASTVLASRVKELAAQLTAESTAKAALQKELDGIRAAGRIPGGQKTGRETRPADVDTSKLSDDDAIEAGLAAAESR